MHYFLGLEVWQSLEKLFLNQGKYAVEILKRFDMLECKAMNTPMETNLKLLVELHFYLLFRVCVLVGIQDDNTFKTILVSLPCVPG
jgi:hypothetical protein